jgi:hypothetical protein
MGWVGGRVWWFRSLGRLGLAPADGMFPLLQPGSLAAFDGDYRYIRLPGSALYLAIIFNRMIVNEGLAWPRLISAPAGFFILDVEMGLSPQLAEYFFEIGILI